MIDTGRKRPVLLVQPPNVKGSLFNLPGLEIPLSLCYLSSYLEQEGIPTEILDLTLHKRTKEPLVRALTSIAPPIVGITAYTPNMNLASDIARITKAVSPQSITVTGGFHPSALPEETLQEYGHFDYLVFGEGEITLAELVKALLNNTGVSAIRGLAYKDGHEVHKNPPRDHIEHLDSLPFPNRDRIKWQQYIPDPGNYYQLPSTGILFSRGCPFRCAFCSKSVFRHSVRYRSVQNFLEEVIECGARYGIRDFRLYDEGPTTNKNKMKELCTGILSRALKITWNCFSRVDTIDYETLSLMKQAGCYHITYGVESGNEDTLGRINKKISLEQAERVCHWTKELGIECKVNFILGFPWESEEHIKRTIDFAIKLSPDWVTFNLFKPLPGSALYEALKKEGALKPSGWEDYFFTTESDIVSARLDPGQQRRYIKKAWFSFYFRPRYVLQRLRSMAANPRREVKNVSVGLLFFLKNMFR